LRPDDSLEEAMAHFVEADLLALPVVDNLRTKKVIGIVKRADLASTYLQQLHGKRVADTVG
jgi:CBS-domain-containing membrane protein